MGGTAWYYRLSYVGPANVHVIAPWVFLLFPEMIFGIYQVTDFW